jgi:hypothetical protein
MATVNNPSPYPQGGVPAPESPVTEPPQQAVVTPTPRTPVVQQSVPPGTPVKRELGEPTLFIYSHSNLLYWWPVWAVGFLMALLSYVHGTPYTVGDAREYFAYSSDVGIIWFVTLFLVILITSVPMRGLASGMVLLGIAFFTVLFAYLHWWDTILSWLGNLSVHMNVGAYMFISTLLFGVWVLSVFLFDRMNYWEVTPGQLTRVRVFGAGQTSYEPENMILEKYRNDFFRHWVLGLGSGDMKITTGGVNRQELHVPNVLFVGQKVLAFQRMIATKPDTFTETKVRT